MQGKLHLLHIDQLQSGQYQPRQLFDANALQELADSIASQGLIEPLIVREITTDCYEIVAGERRWRAAQVAGLHQVPCLVGVYSDAQACAVSLIENIQRQDLHAMEEATGYKRLLEEFHYQQEELALLVGKSRSHVANLVRLLSLTPQVKDLVWANTLSQGHARCLVGLTAGQQVELAHATTKQQWSVRQLEHAVKTYKDKKEAPRKHPTPDRDVARLQVLLAEQLGSPVHIVSDATQGGWLQVQFFDNDTLAGLLDRLGLRYD